MVVVVWIMSHRRWWWWQQVQQVPAFQALTGKPPIRDEDIFVKRLARGGMSSGWVSSLFWAEEFVALLEIRWRWLLAMSVSRRVNPNRIIQ